jgi:hypothetical protein
MTILQAITAYAEEIRVGNALLLAKLQPAQQEQAFANCSREEWNGAGANTKSLSADRKTLLFSGQRLGDRGKRRTGLRRALLLLSHRTKGGL